MKAALHKSPIPDSKIFVVKELREKHFDPHWHSHSEYQLFYVTEGTGTRFIGESIKSFTAGELVLTGPNLPHLWRSEEKYFEKHNDAACSGIVIYLNEHYMGNALAEKEEFLMINKLLEKSMRGIEFYGEQKDRAVDLMKGMPLLHGIESVIVLLQILSLLSLSTAYQYISPVTYQYPLKETETYRMNKVYEFVFKNYRQKISLEDVATLLHMTPTSFSRYFTAINNIPFSRFLAEIRIKNACKMLIETDLPVADICYQSGFNTLSNFNNQFKYILAKTPMEYKKAFMNL